MTNQEIFTTVAKHLLTQNQVSLNIGGFGCMYRSPTGLKCAIGVLIPDHVYDPSLEGCSVRTGAPRDCLLKLGFYPTQIDGILLRLQYIHDTQEPSSWAYHLRKYAEKHNLEMPVL